ncbi:hypothetical protein [Pseudonocardia alaniniphila]|uniref:Uncharacterized protein n=1 Tax=Pseudonocardia alaniniphila TaxID=75291 RepID=A0ABS9TCP6_9PSEU|nr:hypothetical protein [Pseudonocardia alaniniphila]MCH6166168.1 hypothetical protein [Pseudonocardia alaniniphila]
MMTTPNIAIPTQARTVQGVCLILGPLLNAAATFFWTDGRHGVVGGALVAWSCVLWLPGLLGLWEIVRSSRPVLGSTGAALAVIGSFGGIAFGLQGFYEGAFGMDKQQSLDALAAYPLTSQLVLWLPGLTFPLMIVLLAVALARTRSAPTWMWAVLGIGGLLWPVSRIPRIEAIAHVADLAVLVPSAGLGALLIASALPLRPARSTAST